MTTLTSQLKPEEVQKIAEEKYNEIEPITRNVQGWLDSRAGIQLYLFARLNVATPNIVELGSWKGRSTIWLASAIRDRGEGKVYAVDTWLGTPDEPGHAELLKDYKPDQLYEEFTDNLSALNLLEHVEPIRKDTTLAAKQWGNKEIGLLFIDAAHAYPDVRRDFEMWSPYVAPGGFIFFDDVPSWPGPSRLVSELPAWYQFVGASPNQWIVQKTA